MTTRFRRFAGAGLLGGCATLALLAGACGGGGSADKTIDTSNISVDGGKQNAGQATGEQVIEVKDGSFDPATVTIKAGTKVIWKWTSSTSCSLLMGGAAVPEQSSGTYERLFSSGGSTFSYQCAGKPDMVGKITVE